MNLCGLAVLLPLAAAPCLGLFGTPNGGAIANLSVSAVTFALTCAAFTAPGSGLIHADPLGLIFGALTGAVSLTTAIANLDFVKNGKEILSTRRWRLYHAMCAVMLGTTLLGLYADNTGLLWVAVEGATISATLGVSLPRTATALEAAWKYFILGGAGIVLALFGTMLLYLAAQPALGPGLPAMSFSALAGAAPHLDGSLLTLAFVFLLFGYGTKAALVPLHGWLPDAYAEGPAPLTAALSGLMLNVALIAILRFRHLLGAASGALSPALFLWSLGLASLALTAFSLSRRRDARRFFGFSSIEHSGIAIFAFGIGGPAATFGGLLHMLVHTLLKSALFIGLIRAATLRGSAAPGNFGFAHLRGLLATNPALAWTLGACVFGLTGLPPSGLFASEFLIISQTVQRDPFLSLPFGLCLLICAIAIIRVIGPLIFSPPPTRTVRHPAGLAPYLIALHLAAAFIIAFLMPGILLAALSTIAVQLQ
jgi:hydrogenase-4 component F